MEKSCIYFEEETDYEIYDYFGIGYFIFSLYFFGYCNINMLWGLDQ